MSKHLTRIFSTKLNKITFNYLKFGYIKSNRKSKNLKKNVEILPLQGFAIEFELDVFWSLVLQQRSTSTTILVQMA